LRNPRAQRQRERDSNADERGEKQYKYVRLLKVGECLAGHREETANGRQTQLHAYDSIDLLDEIETRRFIELACLVLLLAILLIHELFII